MTATRFAVRGDGRVVPAALTEDMAGLVEGIQRVEWPLWTAPGMRIRREVAEICRLQAARGLTVLGWLATGEEVGDVSWLLASQRLAGSRQERMYTEAGKVPPEVRRLVIANWGWSLEAPLGGQVVAAFLAGGAYPTDGYAAAHATVTLVRLWDRYPDTKPMLAAAWAATRTAADWRHAAQQGGPVFTYPGTQVKASARPWVARLMHGENKIIKAG